jgi:hypothetical protein
MWVIYDKPLDYPTQFVARLWDAMTSKPTATFMIAPSLDDLRLMLPPDLHRLDRMAQDDPCIVEVWL